MEKNAFMSAAKKARIALAVMAVCGMSFAGGGGTCVCRKRDH